MFEKPIDIHKIIIEICNQFDDYRAEYEAGWLSIAFEISIQSFCETISIERFFMFAVDSVSFDDLRKRAVSFIYNNFAAINQSLDENNGISLKFEIRSGMSKYSRTYTLSKQDIQRYVEH